MNQLLLGYIIFTVGALGFLSFASAEEYTINVPFESHGVSCDFDEISVEYHCVWQGEGMSEEEIEQFKETVNQRLDERDDNLIEELNAEALEEIANEPLTPTEKLIEKLEKKYAKGTLSGPDVVLLKMLYELDTCKQGMDNRTLHIQTPREFEISLANDYLFNHVNYDHKLGTLVKAIEECRGQQVVYNASIGYANMVGGEADTHYDHRSQFEGIQAVPYEKLTATTNQIDMSSICDNHQFSDQHKTQAGCVVLYDGKTAEQIKRENEIRFGTDGIIGYDSKLLEDYHAFLETYGNRIATMEDKQVQSDIAEPIAKEMIEDNAFYQNKIKYGD